MILTVKDEYAGYLVSTINKEVEVTNYLQYQVTVPAAIGPARGSATKYFSTSLLDNAGAIVLPPLASISSLSISSTVDAQYVNDIVKDTYSTIVLESATKTSSEISFVGPIHLLQDSTPSLSDLYGTEVPNKVTVYNTLNVPVNVIIAIGIV